MYLNLLAEEFSMTPIKVRKLLISSGAYQTPISEEINKLYRDGKTIKEIQQITGLSAACICKSGEDYSELHGSCG